MAENQTDGYNATWIPGYTKPVDLDPYMYPAAHEKKFDTRKEWATSPQMYHNEIMNNYVTNVSKNLSEIPYVGNVLAAGAELGAPVASGILSLPYELKQSFDDFEKKLAANPEQYNSLGSTASGILQAIDDQNPLSTVYHRTKGALRPLGRRLENTWDALRNEFSGDVEAAEMPIQNRFGNTVGPNPTETILPQEKPFQYDYDTADAFTADEMAMQPIDELTEDSSGIWEALKMAGRVINPFKRDMNPLGLIPRNLSFRRSNLYRPATQSIGSYSPAQLNQMNALGGYYSEPARQQRSERKRVANMLSRQAAGKSYSQANLNRLTMGSRPGHYDPPGGGGAAADTSPSTPGNNPWGRADGGLATMFQRR